MDWKTIDEWRTKLKAFWLATHASMECLRVWVWVSVCAYHFHFNEFVYCVNNTFPPVCCRWKIETNPHKCTNIVFSLYRVSTYFVLLPLYWRFWIATDGMHTYLRGTGQQQGPIVENVLFFTFYLLQRFLIWVTEKHFEIPQISMKIVVSREL